MKQGFFLALAGAVRLLRLALWVGLRLFYAGQKERRQQCLGYWGAALAVREGLIKKTAIARRGENRRKNAGGVESTPPAGVLGVNEVATSLLR